MAGAEERQLRYLFKLKQSANVKKLIGQLFQKEEWVEAGQHWPGRNAELRLSGWTNVAEAAAEQTGSGSRSWRQTEIQTKGFPTVDLGCASKLWERIGRSLARSASFPEFLPSPAKLATS